LKEKLAYFAEASKLKKKKVYDTESYQKQKRTRKFWFRVLLQLIGSEMVLLYSKIS
jgi:hypothetical protein